MACSELPGQGEAEIFQDGVDFVQQAGQGLGWASGIEPGAIFEQGQAELPVDIRAELDAGCSEVVQKAADRLSHFPVRAADRRDVELLHTVLQEKLGSLHPDLPAQGRIVEIQDLAQDDLKETRSQRVRNDPGQRHLAGVSFCRLEGHTQFFGQLPNCRELRAKKFQDFKEAGLPLLGAVQRAIGAQRIVEAVLPDAVL